MTKAYYYNTELYHHGIVGMHWGIRRYQNNDGSLTAEGKERYGTAGEAKNIKKTLTSMDKESANVQYDYKVNEIKRQKLTDKANKAREKGNDEKANEYETKAKEYEKNRDSAEKQFKKIDDKINSVINKALQDGYDIKMSAITRTPSVVKGKQIVNDVIDVVGWTALSSVMPIPGVVGFAAMLTKDMTNYTVGKNIFKKHGQQNYYSEGFRYKVNPGSGTLTQKGQNAHW